MIHNELPCSICRYLSSQRNLEHSLPACTHDVFVGDGEKVPLLVRELDACLSDGLHGRSHVIVTLSLEKITFQFKYTLIK